MRLTAVFFVLCCTVASLAALAPDTAPSPGPVTNGAGTPISREYVARTLLPVVFSHLESWLALIRRH